MSKESDAYRLEMLRRLEEEDHEPTPSNVAEAEKVIAQYREKQANRKQVKGRLVLDLPNPDACPQCFYLHGVETTMRAVGPKDGENPDDDAFVCPRCGLRAARVP